MQILVVHSDRNILDNLETLVCEAGCVATVTTDVCSAQKFLEMAKVDAYILEDHLPDGEGADVYGAQKIPNSSEEFPIVFLHGNNGDWPAQFSTYSSARMPFKANKMMMAIFDGSKAIPPVHLACGPLSINVDGSVSIDGNILKFSERETRILIFLALNQGQPMSSTRILSDIWGQQYEPKTNIVAVYMKNIRAKLSPYELIRTIRGIGYFMEFRP
jgi:DNA-binding response OmpR family regulator